ncbi:MAG TPA: hypothetical protein VFQ53_43695 [Kofleriaceae bacterium]|nr:hypothetical protein [Kofleriaceae bacterium]
MKIGGDNLRMPDAIVSISVRGGVIVAASEGRRQARSVAVFDLATGAVRLRDATARTAAVSHAGDRVALGLGDLGVRVLDGSFAPIWESKVSEKATDQSVAWTPDDAAVAHFDRSALTLLDARTGTVVARLDMQYAKLLGHTASGIAFGADHQVHVVTSSGEVTTFGSLPDYAWVAGDALVATTLGPDAAVEWRDLDGGGLRASARGVRGLARLGVCARTQRVVLHDNRHPIDKGAAADDPLTAQVLGPDGERWSVEIPFLAMRAAFDEDRTVVLGGTRGELAAVDLVDRSVRISAVPASADALSLAFVADARLACGSESGAVLRDVADGSVVATLGGYSHVAAGGERIVAWGNGAALFDRDGARIAELAPATASIQLAAISDDGSRVALAPRGATVTPLVFDGGNGALLVAHGGNGIVERYSLWSANPWSSDDPAAVEGLWFLAPHDLLVVFDNGSFVYREGQPRREVKTPRAQSGIVVGDGFIAACNKEYLDIYTRDGERVEFLRGDHHVCAAAGNVLVVGDETGRIALRDALAKVDLASEQVHAWYVTAVAVDPTRSLIASGGRDGAIIVRPLRTSSR